ncbi:MAG: hypothetical protein U0793_23025 [Gemmataceae bacterium]
MKDQADPARFLAAAREPDRKVRFDSFEKLLDPRQVHRFLALEVITWDWTATSMNRNNYRASHDPTQQDCLYPLRHGPDVRRSQRADPPQLQR